MIEWCKGITEFVDGVYQNSIVFSAAMGILKQRFPLPKFIASVIDKCNMKYLEQVSSTGQLLVPGKLIGLNVTVAGFSLPGEKPEVKEKAKESDQKEEKSEKDPIEFKPNLFIVPIKLTLMEHITQEGLEKALSKLGTSVDILLDQQFGGKKHDEVYMGLPTDMFGLHPETTMSLCEKYLAKSTVRFKIYTEGL